MTQAEQGVPALVARAAAGDDDAWTDLVAKYSGRVYGLMLSRCRDADLAEELTQETFVKLVNHLTKPAGRASGGRYDEQGQFTAYLLRIAMNTLRDELRRRGRGAIPMAEVPDASTPRAGSQRRRDEGWEVLSDRERGEAVRAAVAGLPEADREVLHLRHTAGLTFAQIAATLDQPLGTVLARGHRALKKLRAQLAWMEAEDAV